MSAFAPRFPDLVTLFRTQSRTHAARPLFGTKRGASWEWITYGTFAQVVDEVRGGLAHRGVVRGDRVAVISNNRVEWAAGAYATYGLGGSYVPMYEAQQAKEWEYILRDSGARVVFAANAGIAAQLESMRGLLPDLRHVIAFDAQAGDRNSLDVLRAEGRAHPTPEVSVSPTDVAGFIYTSGTTGNPKGVLLTHRNLASNVSACLDVFPVVPQHRSLSFLPWAHSFGQTAELHMLVGAGASLGICEGIPKILDNLLEVRPSILMAVPNIFNKIYDGVHRQMAAKPAAIQWLFREGLDASRKNRAGGTLSLRERAVLAVAQKLIFTKVRARFGGQLQFAMSGGAALSREVGEFIDALGIEVYEGYGLTETSPVAAVNVPGARRIGTVGKPIPGVRIHIDTSASGTPDEGEIVVHGHCVMQGYHNLPDETARVFTPDGGFRTGDLGRISPDGFVTITGRIKELYKLENGKYVAPVPIESKLQLSPLILQAMVYGANRPFNVAVLVPKADGLQAWAQAQGLSGDVAALLSQPAVRDRYAEEIRQVLGEFKSYEAIRDFILTPEEFTVANDMLTPKLSMKRRNVFQRYESQIEALYARTPSGRAA